MDKEMLWGLYQQNKDIGFRDKLIEGYLPLVQKVVGRMILKLPIHWDKEDVISHGVLGLIEAVGRFNPQKGVKFETFASIRIKGSILDALRDASFLPRGLSDNLFKMGKVIARLEQELGCEATNEQIASAMGLSIEKVDELLLSLLHLACVSLHETLGIHGDNEDLAIMDFLTDSKYPSPEGQLLQKETQQQLAKAIKTLSDRERLILALYYYEELTLKEIAFILEVTESRISQIHSKTLLKLRQLLERK